MYIFNGALSTIKLMTEIDGNNEGLYEGLMVSAIAIGSLIGCVIASFIVKKPRSSRMMIRILDLFTLISIFITCVPKFGTIVAGRVLLGTVISITSVIVPIYVKEITPVEVYGMIGGIDKLL